MITPIPGKERRISPSRCSHLSDSSDSSVVVSDPIPANTTLVPGSLTSDDPTDITVEGNPLTVDVGTLEAPGFGDTDVVITYQVTVDPATNTAGMLSIPRDLYVEIPGYGLNRINVAHFMGDRDNYPGGGPALAKKTVQYNLGVPIHYYIRINFQGFRDVVDALGGITVEVEREIWDDKYPDENYGYMTIYIPAGVQQMDGEMALRYARTRHNGSDFVRLRRQQKVLFAIREKALSLDLIPRLPDLLRTMGYTVDTDLDPQEVLTLAQIARQIEKEDIKSAVIDETMAVSIILPDTGANVLYPLRDKIAAVVEDIFSSSAEGEE